MVGNLGSSLGGLLERSLLLAEDLNAALLSGDNADSLFMCQFQDSIIACARRSVGL